MLAHEQITKALRGSLRHLTEQNTWQKFTKHVQASAAARRRSIILLLLLATEYHAGFFARRHFYL
jgi:hypothetical protein